MSEIAASDVTRAPHPVRLALHDFIAAFVRYQTHVYAYFSIAANPFPGFTGASGYPSFSDA